MKHLYPFAYCFRKSMRFEHKMLNPVPNPTSVSSRSGISECLNIRFDNLIHGKLISFILIREGNFNFRIFIDLLIIKSENKITNLLIIYIFLFL